MICTSSVLVSIEELNPPIDVNETPAIEPIEDDSSDDELFSPARLSRTATFDADHPSIDEFPATALPIPTTTQFEPLLMRTSEWR